MALDDGGLALAGLDHVRVDRALHEEVHRADLMRDLLEDADELLADDLPLPLRLFNARQTGQEALLRVDADEIQLRPWSTNTHTSLSPIASLISAAATEESTPPESANSARPFPTFSRTASIACAL